MIRTLSSKHLPYAVISRHALFSLSKYPLIVLSELYSLSRAERDAFQAYVKNGGRLYISGRSGTYLSLSDRTEENTLLLEDFFLEDLMGVSLLGELPFDSCYLRMSKDKANTHPLGTKAKGAPRIKAHAKTNVLAYATLPFSNHSDNRRFVSAISDPPWERTEIPILTEHTYFKGKCLYSSPLLENDKTAAVSDLWTECLISLLEDAHLLSIDAPLCVEVSVKWVDGTLVLTLLNTLWKETEAPAKETCIRIFKKPLAVRHASVFPSGVLTLADEGESVLVRASSLCELSMITLT